MAVYFTSDLHLGHRLVADLRGFDSTDEHDFTIVENINKDVHKNDKLFILGDVAFTDKGLKWLNNIQCRNIEMLYGNHDKYSANVYLKYVQKLHGFRQYKNYWLSHCPIHPQEMYRCKGNIHGHLHNGGATGKSVSDPTYFNVNVDCNNLTPVPFDYIEKRFEVI